LVIATEIGCVTMTRLSMLDLTPRLGSKEYDTRVLEAQRRWLQLRLHIGGEMGTGELGPGLLFLFTVHHPAK